MVRIKMVIIVVVMICTLPADIISPNYHSVKTIRYIDNLTYYPMYRFFCYLKPAFYKNPEIYEIRQGHPLKNVNFFGDCSILAFNRNEYDSSLVKKLNLTNPGKTAYVAAITPYRHPIKISNEYLPDSLHIVSAIIHYKIMKIVNKTIYITKSNVQYTTETGHKIVQKYDDDGKQIK